MKLDVLHVLPSLDLGGAEHIAVQLLRQSDPRRFATGAACLGPEQHTPLAAQLACAGIPVFFLDKRPGADPACALRLQRTIAHCGPRLLHTHQYVLPYVLPALLTRRELRCVHTVHNLADKEVTGAAQLAHHFAFRLGVTPVAIAEAVKASLQALYRAPEVPLIPNGIRVARYAPDAHQRHRVRRSLGLRPAHVVFVCIARLCEQKNPMALLEAFARGPGQDPRARLVFVGEGALREALEARVHELRLRSVRILGARSNVPALLAAADVFALTSRWEGSPLAVMEAMAAGLPVVATSVGGVPELVHHGDTGLLVPPGASVALATALSRLLADGERRERMGEAAQRHARQHFDSRVMVARYEALYEQKLAERDALEASHA